MHLLMTSTSTIQGNSSSQSSEPYSLSVGISFDKFSVGLSCQNTSEATNGVILLKGSSQDEAASKVQKDGMATDSIGLKISGQPAICTVSRASSYGDINYCICWIGSR